MKLTYAVLTPMIIVLVLGGNGTASADLGTVWTRTCGGAANDGLRSVCETDDGCFAAVG